MQNDALLNVESREIRYAHLKNGELNDLIIERKKSRVLAGNIYRGRVTNILRNIQSAFIDIHEGESGFIHLSDIIENTKKFEQLFDMDFDLEEDESLKSNSKANLGIDELLKIDQPVLVQVVKEPIGTKGARLTSNIALAGRYLVLLPNSPHRGVSRKIEDKETRERLKKLIRAFEMPHDMGLILRTASVHASTDMLIDEANELSNLWKETVDKFNASNEPCLIFEESDIVKRTLITCVDKKFDRLLIDDYAVFQQCKKLYQKYSHEHELRLEYYRDKIPMFERFNVDREIEKATRRKIWLSSGGYLFFDRTEAMYTIDVNSGRSNNNPNVDIEETLVRINLEAAEEIARQLRLRNIGGLVIVDFIDMRLRKNQRRVFERLKECMKTDSAKCTVLGMSEFGLVEMTRQRSRESLVQMLFTHCPYCTGSGLVKNFDSMAIEMERALKKAISYHEQFGLRFVTHPDLDKFLAQEGEKEFLLQYAEKNNAELDFQTSDKFHINDFELYSTITGESLLT